MDEDWVTVRDRHSANHAIHWRLSHPRLRVRETGRRITVEMRVGYTNPTWHKIRTCRSLAGAVFWCERQIAGAPLLYVVTLPD